MSHSKTLEVPERVRSYLIHKVQIGQYDSEEAALIGIVEDHMDHELALAEERRAVAVGIADDDAGRYSDRNVLDIAAAAKRDLQTR